jgi:hypothetical protein
MKRRKEGVAREELTVLERKAKFRLDEPESADALAALRDAGVLDDPDWRKIRAWYREALPELANKPEPERNAKGLWIIYVDADTRNANWTEILRGWDAIGFKLPGWATCWLWRLGYERPKAFWKRVARVAMPWRVAEPADDDGRGQNPEDT